MIAEPLPRHMVLRGATGRPGALTSTALAKTWAVFADDQRAITLKILLLVVAAVITAILEAPWQ